MEKSPQEHGMTGRVFAALFAALLIWPISAQGTGWTPIIRTSSLLPSGFALVGITDGQSRCEPKTECVSEEASLRRGLERMYGGDLRGALLEFNGALQANPRSIEALFQRGNVQFRLGDPAAAIADYTRALELSPDHYEVLVARGHALMKQGDTKRAAADFGMARAIEEAIEKK